MYGKSASAGGASMTPSSVACVCAVIEVMRVRLPAAAQLIAAHGTMDAPRTFTTPRCAGAAQMMMIVKARLAKAPSKLCVATSILLPPPHWLGTYAPPNPLSAFTMIPLTSGSYQDGGWMQTMPVCGVLGALAGKPLFVPL